MRLADFYERIGPLLLGRQSANDAARSLWGERPPSPDAERLGVYERFCRAHRFDAVDHVYEELRKEIVGRFGEARWESLVEGYFQRYPMRSVELNENGGWLAAYLKEGGAGPRAPAWLADLADLEWWEWRTYTAPDSPSDARPAEGPLRLASTVELRAYGRDLVGWLQGGAARAGEPPAGPATVVFWRDAQCVARRANASAAELAALKCVFEEATPHVPGLAEAELDALLGDLRDAGILLGRP